MAVHRKFMAVVVASLLAGATPAKITYIGTVVHADRAHVGDAEATVGGTIFEGDRLSTEAGGLLRVTVPSSTLQLSGQSSLVIRRGGDEGNTFAELASGALVFSVAASGNMAVAADAALMRPAAKVATIARVRVLSGKELLVYAQRGALEFSYRGQRETMAEGQTYRVILDPSEREDAGSGPGANTKPPAKRRRTFILLVITFAVAAAAIAIPPIVRHFEGPDRPGLAPPAAKP